MGSRIPKPKSTSQNRVIGPYFISTKENVSFSFAAIERTEYFNLDGTCENWASELFEMLKNASNYPKVDLITNKLRTYRVHNHENAKPPSPLPKGVALKDCYQIRISKAKGGIHGVFNENVFYVIWFDPLHNMYPDDRVGGLRKVHSPSSCCKDRDEIIAKLKDKIIQLEEDCRFWESEAGKVINIEE
ncbi:MAG TPA: hypothetical protein GX726_05265 [Clostridiales bacterium]|jgi:hypothetical protein|nr:hypothetical protein [Clostridiales bacterium]